MTIFFPCDGFLTWLLVPAPMAAVPLPTTKLFPPKDSLLFVPGWWCWAAILSKLSKSSSSVKELVWCNDGGLLLELLSFCRLRFGGVLKFNLVCFEDELLDEDEVDDTDDCERRLLSFRFLPLGGRLLLFDPLPLTDIQTTKKTDKTAKIRVQYSS